MKRVAATCACVLLIGATAGCGEDRNDSGGPQTPHGAAPAGGEVVNTTLREWLMTADVSKVRAGEVKFVSANVGTIVHELVIIRTDIPDGQIPIEGTKFNEEAPGVSSPGEISEFGADLVKEAVVTLEPGQYQLVCNIETHYQHGMHIPFVVI